MKNLLCTRIRRPVFNPTPGFHQGLDALLGAVLLATMVSAQAQTYTWADTAQGQIYLICGGNTNYWPSNANWSQSYFTNGNCDHTGSVESQPSNWLPTPPYGLYPGGPGDVGADVILGAARQHVCGRDCHPQQHYDPEQRVADGWQHQSFRQLL